MKISRAAVERLEGKEKKQAEAMLSLLPKLKNDLVAECKKNEWSEKARKCMLAAKDEKEARVCRKHIDGGSAKGLGESEKQDEPAKTGSTDTPPAAATSADTPADEKKAAGGATPTADKPATESPAAAEPAAAEPTE